MCIYVSMYLCMYVCMYLKNSKIPKNNIRHIFIFFLRLAHNPVNMKISPSTFVSYLTHACKTVPQFKHDLGNKTYTARTLADRHPETGFACAYKQNIKTRDKQSIYVNASRALKEMRASMLPESDNDSTGLTAHSIEELEKKLNEAEREIAELKAIVAKHETIDQDRKAKVVNFLISL